MTSNFLILGNGYDRAMKSKTAYSDFIEFYGELQQFSSFFPTSTEPIQTKSTVILQQIWDEHCLGNTMKLNLEALKNTISEHPFDVTFWKERLEHNAYLEYIKEHQANLGKNWSDLEHRVEDISEAVEDIITSLDTYKVVGNALQGYRRGVNLAIHIESEIKPLFKNRANSSAFTFIFNTINNREEIRQHRKLPSFQLLQEVNQYFIDELEELNFLLQLYFVYLEHVEEGLKKQETVLDELNNIQASYILTFNYTNTARCFIKNNIDNNRIHHIHGQIRSKNLRDNNLIFGIEDKSNDINSTVIAYQKYYQRIVKATGSKYKQFFKEFRGDLNIIIFGHSLDPLDKEVFLDIFNLADRYEESRYRGKYRIIVVYYDDSAKRSIVKNLSIILGKERLVQLTGENKLHFVQSNDNNQMKSLLLTD